jgi:hypothetical protein
MNEFTKRLNIIYPSSVLNFIIITILCVIALFFTFDPDNIASTLTILVLLVWFNVLLTSADIFMVRRKVFNLIKIGKKDLVEYLNYRISREKRKIRLFRRKEENPIIEKLKNFILDIEKDRLIKWN